ncbi:hypothetical protein AX774_g743 [Zancudomyces culisetae]|uniref:Uncharacterized protein n=1 Tax=Zancudomyces culisetae TaxID=1213189 RepID=A0A1R1PXN8_ZANCU|nr:hypothetical protein AX774_g743 [Zancudomyces culisetae]|eukprot:OMH85713.1 hypothetical protein AX774_g743 [Zancudomyces culisetae]
MAEVMSHAWMNIGYKEIAADYVPIRKPLVHFTQIDMNIVRIMAQYPGFGFGNSEQEIYKGIKDTITSDWYQQYLTSKYSKELIELDYLQMLEKNNYFYYDQELGYEEYRGKYSEYDYSSDEKEQVIIKELKSKRSTPKLWADHHSDKLQLRGVVSSDKLRPQYKLNDEYISLMYPPGYNKTKINAIDRCVFGADSVGSFV